MYFMCKQILPKINTNFEKNIKIKIQNTSRLATMKLEIDANCCRLCLTKSKKLRSIYKPIDDGEEPPNEMLQMVAGIEVEEMEKFTMLPKNICKNCELSLSMAYEFREKVLQSQQAIESFMQELQIPYPEVEKASAKATRHGKHMKQEEEELIEVQQLDESTLDDNLNLLDSSSNSQLNLDASQKCEIDYVNDVHGVEEFTEETLDNVESYEFDDLNDSFNEEELHEQQYEELDNDDDDVVHIEDEVEEHNAEQQHQQCEDEYQQEFLSEKENERTTWNLDAEEIEEEVSVNSKKVSQKGKKKLPKQVSYICDICGNVYAKRGRMMEHRQRHDKQLKFSCELCDEKFHMRELLRKHMYSHSGGKPLKCKYCSRTFYYESVRKAHEAVHQGVKPYVCDVCGKPFSYSHSLKKHKLIHAEVKLYRCEYCNKDFRLQHHMKQHKLTRLHKKAVNMAEFSDRYTDNNASPSPLEVDEEEQLSEDILMDDGELIEEQELVTDVS